MSYFYYSYNIKINECYKIIKCVRSHIGTSTFLYIVGVTYHLKYSVGVS